jgi:hypothetical protein
MKINMMNVLLVILLILGICIIIGGTKETFIARGEYPYQIQNTELNGYNFPYGLLDLMNKKQIMLDIGLALVMEQVHQLICAVVFMIK